MQQAATPPPEGAEHGQGEEPSQGGEPGQGEGERELLYRDLGEEGFAKSVPLFGSDIRFSIGGYVKFDLIGDFSGTGDRSQFLTQTIPVPGTDGPDDGSYVNLHAKESRIGFDIRNVAAGLPFNQAYIEYDFYGNDESYGSVRLRHAYLRWGNLLAGRTWSLLTDMRPLPFLVDFAYGDALYGGRTSQVRWEQQIDEHSKVTAGIELADDQGIENVAGLEGVARANLPALALRGDHEWDSGSISIGGIIGQVRWDGEGAIGDDTAMSWAANLNLRQFLGSERRHYVGTQLAVGDGTGNGVAGLGGQGASAVLTPDGSLETMPVWVASVALHYEWNKSFSSNFAFAWTEIDPAADRDPDAIKMVYASHANLIWQVAAPFRVGAEVMSGVRENTDGKDGDAQRIQFMAMYSF